MNGIGYLLAGMVLVLYFQRLALHHMPGKEVVVTTFLPLGPCGQGGYSLLELGRVSRTLFPIISERHPNAIDGLAYLHEAANPLYGFGLGVGLLSFALGLWFACFACASLLRHRLNGTVAFGIGWWGLTFPREFIISTLLGKSALTPVNVNVYAVASAFLVGSLNLLTYSLAHSFDSMFLKVLRV